LGRQSDFPEWWASRDPMHWACDFIVHGGEAVLGASASKTLLMRRLFSGYCGDSTGREKPARLENRD